VNWSAVRFPTTPRKVIGGLTADNLILEVDQDLDQDHISLSLTHGLQDRAFYDIFHLVKIARVIRCSKKVLLINYKRQK